MRSELRILDVESGEQRLLLETHRHIEAPNWTPDGRRLVVNAEGRLHRVDAEQGGEPIPIESNVPPVNNDHVLAPYGYTVYASANDGHIYAIPIGGGAARRITDADGSAGRFHFLHGVSPDGTLLAYVAVDVSGASWTNAGLWKLPATGGAARCLVGGVPPKDGPEFSPDGAWLYFNGDVEVDDPGHSQLYRLPLAGGDVEQLTDDDRVNWFPHLSPDGARMVHLSYPPGTQGHPAGRDVLLRLSDPLGRGLADLARLRGGQGTINVPSWAPDSKRFAFVAYPD